MQQYDEQNVEREYRPYDAVDDMLKAFQSVLILYFVTSISRGWGLPTFHGALNESKGLRKEGMWILSVQVLLSWVEYFYLCNHISIYTQ